MNVRIWIAALVLALTCACRSASERERVTPEFAAHAPQAIRVLSPIDRAGSADAPALVQRLAERELRARGYGDGSASATLHLVIETWSSARPPHIELEASLYDDASGTLLWSAACEVDPDEDEDDEDSGVIDDVFDYLVGSVAEAVSPEASAEDAVARLLVSFPRRRDAGAK